jgi:uncharacterized protein (DUF3084 family)
VIDAKNKEIESTSLINNKLEIEVQKRDLIEQDSQILKERLVSTERDLLDLQTQNQRLKHQLEKNSTNRIGNFCSQPKFLAF